MRRLILVVIGVIVLGGGVYSAYKEIYLKKRGGNSALLSVNTPYSEAGVFIDDTFVGPTPFFGDDLKPGVSTVRVGEWVGRVTLAPGTLTVINQDLGPSVAFTSGEVIWLEKTANKTSLAIISTPDGAEIHLDGEKIGETPLVTSKISPGDYLVVVAKPSYVTREMRLRVQENYKLNVTVQLMLRPIPEEIKSLEVGIAGLEVKDFSTENTPLLEDVDAWVEGTAFYLKSHKTVSENKVNYLLDLKGTIYDENGASVAAEQVPKTEGKLVIGYLGERSVEGVSPAALKTLQRVAEGSLPEVVRKPQVEILPTGTGWLRVRSGPGLGQAEITKVNVGEKFEFLEEQSGWYKIRLSDGQEGWISGQYAKKLE